MNDSLLLLKQDRDYGWRTLLCTLALLCLLPLLTRAEIESTVDGSVKNAVDSLLTRLQQEGPGIKQDTARIDKVARELVLPHFDFAQMSQRALGRHWPDFSNDQRARFVEAFQTLMIRTYSRAIADYRDASVKYEPARELNSGTFKVRTQIRKPNANDHLQLDFVVRKIDAQWRAIDVTLDGVSLVVSYRAGFDTDIAKSGIDGLIQQIEKRNTST